MIMVGTMVAVIWLTGVVMKTPRSARWTMILLLLVCVMALQIALPQGHPLREATGGDARLWALVIAFGLGIWGYSILLGRLKARVQQPEAFPSPAPVGKFSETELNRYARHMMLREVGGPGQKALRDAKVLVIGAGGLGAAALQYLAAAGVGTIGVIDDDIVENTNLQRQVIHKDASIGLPKVHSAAEAMQAQNPFVTVKPYHRRLDETIAEALFSEYDLVLDGTDNFPTRYLANAACVRTGRPLIAGALTQWEGQISIYDPSAGTPCYACIFPKAPEPHLVPTCAEAGVIGPLPGVIGAMMALEALKVITAAGETLRGRMLIYDALFAETRIIAAKPRADCSVCKGKGLQAG
ncbi:Molybdopterin or thiamine biosynthesis adenylyltransferase [Cognatiyoonia koreensis]|uniref:Molybdopterin-synthase adenylyltransferase n=1 Tax=Cognatiyoonia koreensis TaxID=364200 RepID=A0A1I0QKN6_9RHOB|nr:molybdopterin-synthase adenylyltransferase MoeB [Cognatiyoonia koreensis]SEW27627.1 Molybdopterin or thiamine biosynthesis adenylyltransferase [Cognatiyoonia koreensis]